MAVVNAFLMYQEIGHDSISLFEFRRSLALGLLTYSQKCRLTQSKNRGIKYSVPDTVRLSNFGIHWVEFVESRGRCQVCSVNKKKSRPQSKCSYCNVYLCCNVNKNCFKTFHKK